MLEAYKFFCIYFVKNVDQRRNISSNAQVQTQLWWMTTNGSFFTFYFYNSRTDEFCNAANDSLCRTILQLSARFNSLELINPFYNCSYFTVNVDNDKNCLESHRCGKLSSNSVYEAQTFRKAYLVDGH
jgi:hypothetical protein